MNNEKKKILDMVQKGVISSEEALNLLSALDENATPAKPGSLGNRCLRIRVNGSSIKKVNVNIPLSLLKVAGKFANFGMKFVPNEAHQEMKNKGIDINEIDFNELVSLIDQGLVDGKIVDVDIDDPKEGQMKVEMYVD